MHTKQSANWVKASHMLREAMELYREEQQRSSLAKVIDDLIGYIEEQSGKWLSEKTLQRDISNRDGRKKVHTIPGWRIKVYTRWMAEQVGKREAWLAEWLNVTAYSAPGKLLVELGAVDDAGRRKNPQTVKTNVPPLKSRLWGRFLGRQAELERLREWADQQRHPIAVLCGFGGNGKTTLQQKAAEEFVYGTRCSLRWPYEATVWISAADSPRGQVSLQDVLQMVALVCELYGATTHEDLGIMPSEVVTKDVTDLLEQKRILVLLDNFETIASADQVDILQFFHRLRGASQMLISSRYRPDWFLEAEQGDMYHLTHVLIPIEGLSDRDAQTLIHDFLAAKTMSREAISSEDIVQLTALTGNNPKTLLTILGLLEEGILLQTLWTSLKSGSPDADRMYHLVIDQAWTTILSNVERSVLMAKALCSYSVSETDLGHIAGIEGMRLHDALKRLAAISFFEFDRLPGYDRRVRTHLLAQDFARRVLHDAPEFEAEAEQRWWEAYAPKIAQQAGTPDSENQESLIDDDLANVLERLEWHLTQHTPYAEQAARLFGKQGGLGYSLLWRGHYDDVLRIAEPVLQYGIVHQDLELVGQCALRLIAVIHIKRQNFENAENYIGLAFDYNARMHDIWLEATIDSVRAFLYTRRGYLSAAQQCCRNALKLGLELDLPYDSGVAYRVLGEIQLALTGQHLENACDTHGELRDSLEQADHYFGQAEAQLQKARDDLGCHFTLGMIRMDRGIIARLQSRFDLARTLLRDSLNAFNSSYSIATVYRELALVEHLSGNRDLSHSYDEQGIRLFQQIGMGDNLPPSHCSKIIATLKQQGTW